MVFKSIAKPLWATLFAGLLSVQPHLASADDLMDSNPNESKYTQDISESDYQTALAQFRAAPQSAAFFEHAYGYAIFPTVGKVGVFIGGSYGQGRVYEQERFTGTAELIQATIGFQLGGQAFSQIVFFQDQRAYDEFTGGGFEFGAQASAIVITAGVNAEASTKGTSASANAGEYVKAEGQYYKGMAVFSLAKGGLMYEATLGGQKFNFYPQQ